MLCNSLVVRLAAIGMLLAACRMTMAEEPTREANEPNRAVAALLADYLEALDRMDLEAAERITREAVEKYPGRPETELMVRHTRLLAAKKAQQSRSERTRQAVRADKDRLFAVTYNVADVVAPTIPGLLSIAQVGTAPKAADPDFDSLIELLECTVKPGSWVSVGGRGMIVPWKANMSIIIMQTQDVHEKIEDFLEQLRRLQNIYVLTRVCLLRIPDEAMEDAWEDKETPGIAVLPPEKAKRLVNTAQRLGSSNFISMPSIVQHNGGTTCIFSPLEYPGVLTEPLFVRNVISADRRFVRLVLETENYLTKIMVPCNPTVCISVADGTTLVVELASEVIKKKVDGEQSDANPTKVHRLLLLTPWIVIGEEEEERIDSRASRTSGRQPAKRPAAKFDFTPQVPSY